MMTTENTNEDRRVTSPLVSTIIIFLDAEKYLAEAIESVFAQTYSNWELLLVDDGSSDRSSALAQGCAARHPARVRYLEHPEHENRGMSASRNLGLRYARGDYVAFLDADDVWVSHKLAAQVEILRDHPEAMMVYGRTEMWYSWTGLPEDSHRDFTYDLGVEPNTIVEPPTLLLLQLENRVQTPTTCSALARRELFDRVGGFVESFRGLYEDQAFFAKACLAARAYVSGALWARYRQHPESCCAIAEQTGAAFRERLPLLQWIEEYLTEAGVDDDRIWRELETQKSYYAATPSDEPPEPADREVRVSVVVPFRNPGPHLECTLESLARQECEEGWEVVLVDNGSTDGSRAAAAAFSDRVALRIVDAREKAGPSYARNAGARAAQGDKLLFVDADDEVGPGYVAAMAAALEAHDVVTSLVDSTTLNAEWVRAAHGPPWQEDEIVTYFDFLPATGTNIGVRRALFESVGSFPEEFVASEDMALSWRIQLDAGTQLHLVRDAVYRYRYRESVTGLFRQSLRWGISTVLLYRRFRGAGMPGRTLRAALGEWFATIAGLAGSRSKTDVAPFAVRLGYCVGRLVGSFRYGVAYL